MPEKAAVEAQRFIVIPEEKAADDRCITIEAAEGRPASHKKPKRVFDLTNEAETAPPHPPADSTPQPAQLFLRNLVASSVKSHPIDEDTVEEISPLKPQDISLSLLRPQTERLLEQHRQLISSISGRPSLVRGPQQSLEREALPPSVGAAFRSSTSCLLPAPQPPAPVPLPASTAPEQARRDPGLSVDEHLKAIALCFHSPLAEVRLVFAEVDGDLARVREHFIKMLSARQS